MSLRCLLWSCISGHWFLAWVSASSLTSINCVGVGTCALACCALFREAERCRLNMPRFDDKSRFRPQILALHSSTRYIELQGTAQHRTKIGQVVLLARSWVAQSLKLVCKDLRKKTRKAISSGNLSRDVVVCHVVWFRNPTSDQEIALYNCIVSHWIAEE